MAKPHINLEETAKKELHTVISGKTGLTPAEDAIMKNLPKTYADKTVGEALDYLVNSSGLEDEEVYLAKSIEREMGSGEYVVVINGKNADLHDNIEDYLEIKEHKLPDNKVRYYNALEIEVSSIQEGGYKIL